MDDTLERVSRAVHAFRTAERRAEDTRRLLHAAIVEALHAGVRQVDLVRVTGYTRERIRQLARSDEFSSDDDTGA
ncbi:MAG TPA: hypothetical protein VHX59_06075 [Mycobacteriales bacterium]|jgi:hypothetical protein|nr:hypothetical protein [Mycobacteriales bacterium]